MSAVSILDVQLRAPSQEVIRPRVRPAPIFEPAAKPVVKVRVRTNVLGLVATRAFAFATVVAFTYGVSSLAGQVAVERARQDGIAAVARASAAVKAEASLQGRLNLLQNSDQIDTWASSHGFSGLKG